MKNLDKILQENQLSETLREAYLPENIVSPEEALLFARRRQKNRRTITTVGLSLLVLVFSAYWFLSLPSTPSSTTIPVVPVPLKEIAKTPSSEKIGTSLPTPPNSQPITQPSSRPTSQKVPSSMPGRKKTSSTQPSSSPTERP